MRKFLQARLDAFRDHELPTYATAIAMRALIGFAALTFLALAVLGATGDTQVWEQHIAPAIDPKLTHPTFVAITPASRRPSRAIRSRSTQSFHTPGEIARKFPL